ncbi:CapA family protein [Paenibacillus koleovorans]|uniref:CapA family protein n=1 Tax=Paenibacillus koleovorans TaxID=121608 RepID=UPI001FE87CCB|nr:CapA family protein [Paenibacillus koleovorans]
MTAWAVGTQLRKAESAQPTPTPSSNGSGNGAAKPSPSAPAAGSPTPTASSTVTPKPSATVSPTPGSSAGTTGSPTPTPSDSSRVKLSFVGDVIFASTVETVLRQNGFDYGFAQVKSVLQDADLAIANLETPITTRGDEQKKEYVYRSTPDALPAFAEAGFDLVNLANNHILDYGVDGLLDTFKHLDKTGIKYFGAGHNAEEAFRPVIVEKKGIKIAFLGLSRVVPDADWKAGKDKNGKDRPGVADTYGLDLPLKAITDAKSKADLVVVIPHWGIERNDMPEAYQKEYARKYIDAGADLIVGGHPHVLQGFEQYKGKWIAYSMGNFLFTTRADEPKTWDSGILQASCSKTAGCELKLVPVLTKWAQPVFMQEPESVKLFERLSGISFGAIVNKDGTIRAQ